MKKIINKEIRKSKSVINEDFTGKNSSTFRNVNVKDFWDNNYRTGNTCWDLGEISSPLKNYIDQIKNKDIKILLPGCGNAYEAEYLSNNGFKDITLLDISSVITDELKKKFAEDKNIKVICMNFFEHEIKYDLILEQTFFCALIPDMRKAYSEKMKSLINENGKIVGILFDREFEKDGPPFGGSIMEYEELFKKYFDVKVLEKCYNSVQARYGNEVFINLIQKK